MKTAILYTTLLTVVLAFLVMPSLAAAVPGEGIVFDSASGNYNITYWEEVSDDTGHDLSGLSKATFEPATKIDPVISSSIKMDENKQMVYRYKLSNGMKSKQMLVRFVFDLTGNINASRPLLKPISGTPPDKQSILADLIAGVQALDTPSGWDGAAVPNFSGLRISWSYLRTNFDITQGVKPGASQSGFGFSSQDLPGIGIAQLQGNVKVYGLQFSGEGVDPGSDIGKQALQLVKNNFVPHSAAVPTIAVPTPFDPAVLLERIQTHMHTWIGMKLLDATFSSQLDSYFQSAISAYRLNQPQVGKKQIQTMLALINKEHTDLGRDEEHESDKTHEKNDDRKSVLIDRLAARVLDFDLKYVTKRMGGDKDD